MSWTKERINKNPTKLFIQDGNSQYSYQDVGEMVKAYSQAFLKDGIHPQDKILIYLPGGIEMVEIILACFEIGAVASPISQGLTNNELNAVIASIQPKLIITNWDGREAFISVSFPLICIEEFLSSAGGCSIYMNEYKNNKHDVCTIILTSGTTGIPKAVQLTFSNFIISCSNWNDFLNFKSNDQFLCCLPLYHIGGLAVIIRALLYGFSVNLITKFQAEIVLKIIQNYPVTIISLVPTMLKRIIAIDGGLESLKKLRHILLGGGPAPGKLLDTCIKEKLPIVKVYGMSETCSGTFGLKLLDEPSNKFYAGRPFPGAKVKIDNNEIHISGPMIMKGYIGESEANGIHNSHDLGRIDSDNLLFLDIRRKDLIISGGENINPLEVEECLLNVNGISDAAVVGKEDDEWGERVIAYIVSRPLDNELIQRELIKYLSAYKIPKDYIRVPNIPRNELGKIMYDKLKV